MDTEVLHTLNDGSKVLRMPMSRLLEIPVWQGNRIISQAHVSAIARSVKDNIKFLDSGYRTVRYQDTDAAGKPVMVRNIVDGQHRMEVLRRHINDLAGFVGDFDVLVTEKDVNSELEIIEHFNMINAVNPIKWTDKNLVINAYIAELEFAFNTVKVQLIRNKSGTKRPFLSVEKLRNALAAQEGRLHTNTGEIKEFVGRVQEWNRLQLAGADIRLLGMDRNAADSKMWERCIEKKFMLAYDPKLEWIADLLM
jgi:hypothetical protein